MTTTAASTSRRLLTAVALTVAAWFATPSAPVHATPTQTMIEYGATLEAGAKAADTGKSASGHAQSFGDKVGDFINRGKSNTPLVIVGVGVLLVMGTWKFATR